MGNYQVRFGGRERRVLIEARPSRPNAEMTAALLGADLGLPTSHIDDHAAYFGSWLKVLRKDSRAIMTAAAKAEAAASYLLRATGLDAADELEDEIREAA